MYRFDSISGIVQCNISSLNKKKNARGIIITKTQRIELSDNMHRNLEYSICKYKIANIIETVSCGALWSPTTQEALTWN